MGEKIEIEFGVAARNVLTVEYAEGLVGRLVNDLPVSLEAINCDSPCVAPFEYHGQLFALLLTRRPNGALCCFIGQPGNDMPLIAKQGRPVVLAPESVTCEIADGSFAGMKIQILLSDTARTAFTAEQACNGLREFLNRPKVLARDKWEPGIADSCSVNHFGIYFHHVVQRREDGTFICMIGLPDTELGQSAFAKLMPPSDMLPDDLRPNGDSSVPSP